MFCSSGAGRHQGEMLDTVSSSWPGSQGSACPRVSTVTSKDQDASQQQAQLSHQERGQALSNKEGSGVGLGALRAKAKLWDHTGRSHEF